MTRPLELARSRTFPATVENAFETVLTVPLERIFSQRYAAIPPIKEVREQEGTWGAVGQTRRIVLADGGTMREELTSVERGVAFHYRISEVTGALKPLVASVEGRWVFEPVGTGVRITWAWTVEPVNSWSELTMPVLAWMWRGYARLALEGVEALLLPGQD